MYGKTQEYGLTEIIAFICISAIRASILFSTSWAPLGLTLGSGYNLTAARLQVFFFLSILRAHQLTSEGCNCWWLCRKSRNTWSNRQIWPWNMEWSRAKTNRVLPRKCTGHNKHPLLTTQEKTLHMDITRWSTLKSDWLCSLQPKMEKLCTVSKNKTRSWLRLRPWTPYCQIQT